MLSVPSTPAQGAAAPTAVEKAERVDELQQEKAALQQEKASLTSTIDTITTALRRTPENEDD